MQNEALKHALHRLAHPLSLLMIMVLIVNDHIFKHTIPSWWTGKLSDVAGLAFAPLLIAVFLALIIPSKIPYRKSIVFWSAFYFVSVIFTLLKISPSFNQIFREGLHILTSNQHSIVLDPTDLLTLPAIFIAYWLWHTNHEFQPSHLMIVLGLGLASMGILATSPGEILGAYCLQSSSNTVVLLVDGETFISEDGGLTWESTFASGNWDYAQCNEHVYQGTVPPTQVMSNNFEWKYVSPKNSQFFARFNLYTIEISTNSGQTWQTEYSLENTFDKKRPKESSSFCCGFIINTGPQDAILDEQTGNLVVAMGYHGILVRKANNNWQWVGVGEYDYDEMMTSEETRHQQQHNNIMAHVFLISMIIAMITINVVGQSPGMLNDKNIYYNVLACGFLLLSFLLIQFSTSLSLVCLIPLVIGLAIISLVVLDRQVELYRFSAYIYALFLSIIPLIIFVLPFYIWNRDILNDFMIVNYFAFGGTIISISLVRYIFQHYVKPRVMIE